MAIQGFDKTFYLNAKLEQLQNDPQTAADWAGKDADFLEARLQNGFGLTAEQHYEQYGFQEGLAPNAFFSPDEYIRAKATAMFNDSDSDYLTVDAAAEDFVSTWNEIGSGNVYEHYLQYGEDEGVNPSNDFDVSAYYEAKLAQLKAEGNTDITTVEGVKAAFEAAGITALEHFVEFGQDEGITAPAVPADEQVEVDDSVPGQTFMLTAGQDNLTGTADDDTFNAAVVADSAGAGALVDSLQNVDVLDGGEGEDTLNVTLNGGATVTPSLANVENVELRSTTDSANLALSNATGVEQVTVAKSTGTSTVSGLGTISNLNVANQSENVTFSGSTATALTLGLNNVAAGAATNVDLDDAAATTLNLELTDNDGSLLTLDQNAGTATTINATLSGDNVVDFVNADDAATTLNVEGDGSLTADANSSTFAALTDLNVTGDASVDLDAISIGALETVAAGDTTGDVAVQVDDTATAITTGSGDDSVTQTAALAADTAYDLGAGDDTYVLGTATDDKTASVDAGDGDDTLSMIAATAVTVSADADIAAIYKGFETLNISDVLADASATDVSAFSGIASFTAADGVATDGTATVTEIGADATVTLAGDLGTNNGMLDVDLASTSGANDSLNFVINTDIAVVDDANVDKTAATATVDTSGVETLNVESTGTLDATISEGNPLDVADNTLVLTNDDLVTLNISGDQALTFATAATQDQLETIDASANTAGVEIDASASVAGSPALTITGTAEADVITGGDNGDTLTLGGGNDIVDYNVGGASTIGTGTFDTITDFSANTFGSGTDGAAGDGETAGTQADWTGDVLRFTADADGAAGGVKADVLGSAADATTFLSNNAGSAEGLVAALDSSTGNLYVDNTDDGVADFYIQLQGVTTIDEAAFALV